MAWSSAAVAASDVALLAADKPILIGANAIETTTAAIWNDLGTTADTDETATGYETYYTYDRYTHAYSKPSSAKTTWYLVYTLDGTQRFDCCIIAGHNFAAITPTSVTLQISTDDGGTFAAPLDLAQWTDR